MLSSHFSEVCEAYWMRRNMNQQIHNQLPIFCSLLFCALLSPFVLVNSKTCGNGISEPFHLPQHLGKKEHPFKVSRSCHAAFKLHLISLERQQALKLQLCVRQWERCLCMSVCKRLQSENDKNIFRYYVCCRKTHEVQRWGFVIDTASPNWFSLKYISAFCEEKLIQFSS